MLKNSIKQELIKAVYEDLILPENFSQGEFKKTQQNNDKDIDNTLEYLKTNEDNLEKFVVEEERTKLVSNIFSKEDVYDDFIGKNPKMNIYNSYENIKNIKYKKKENNKSINNIFLDLFYDLKYNLKNMFLFTNFLNLKQIFIFIFLFLFSIFNNSIIFLLFLFVGFFNLINYTFFVIFKASLKYKFFYRHYNLNAKVLFCLLKILNIFCLFFSKFIMINLKELINMVMKLFYFFLYSNSCILEESEKFIFSKVFKSDVNREKRNLEHIEMFNLISKISKDKLKSINKHELDYLKKFHFKEFVFGRTKYELLPEGERKEYYKFLALQENISVKKQVNIMILSFYSKKIKNKTKLFYNVFEKYIEINKENSVKKNNKKLLLQNKNLQDKIEENTNLIGEFFEEKGIKK